MSDASRMAMRCVEETTYGTCPSGSGVSAMQELRFTGESLKANIDSVESAEIRDDRQIADVKRTSLRASGDMSFEFSYGSFDDFLEAALFSAGWSSEVSETDTNYSIDDADNSINDSSNGFVTDGFTANQWAKISGFTAAANNGYFKLSSVAAGKMVLSGGTVVTEIAGDAVTIQMGAQVVNGTTESSFSIEKEFADLSQEFALYTGMEIDTVSIDVAAEGIITGSFGFVGQDETSQTATSCVGSAVAAATTSVFSAVDDVTGFLENMSDMDLTAFTLSLANNLRELMEVGEVGPTDIGAGSITISGTLQAYFESKTLLDKYLAVTATSLSLVLEDAAGNGYVIDLPQVRLTDGGRVAGGKDTDIVEDIGWSAYRDSSEDVTIRIARFPAA